jgi:hypothetical protein
MFARELSCLWPLGFKRLFCCLRHDDLCANAFPVANPAGVLRVVVGNDNVLDRLVGNFPDFLGQQLRGLRRPTAANNRDRFWSDVNDIIGLRVMGILGDVERTFQGVNRDRGFAGICGSD